MGSGIWVVWFDATLMMMVVVGPDPSPACLPMPMLRPATTVSMWGSGSMRREGKRGAVKRARGMGMGYKRCRWRCWFRFRVLPGYSVVAVRGVDWCLAAVASYVVPMPSP